MTQNIRIGLDGKKHRRNLNILICGSSGAGKTRFFCKPNAMQCNTSMVILDQKGEILRDVGGLLESKGYEVRVLDLALLVLFFVVVGVMRICGNFAEIKRPEQALKLFIRFALAKGAATSAWS